MSDSNSGVFHDTRGQQLKLDGMERAADNRKQHLELGRKLAKEIALRNPSRTVNADQVGRALQQKGIDTLGAAAGSLFRSNEFVFSGEFVKSKRVKNHSRLLRVWRYVG